MDRMVNRLRIHTYKVWLKYYSLRTCSLCFLIIVLWPLSAAAQLGSQESTACINGAASFDSDKLVHCTSTSSTAGTFQKAPIIIGEVTSPPYSGTTCDSTRAGIVQYKSNIMYFCDGSDWTSLFPIATAVVGEINIWPTSTIPSGYLECDGSAVSRTTYSALFAAIGTIYGVGDGSTTFNIPDYRGEFLRGWDHSSGNDPDAASRTDRGDGTTGDVIGSKQTEALISHAHSVNPPSTTTGASGSHRHTYRKGKESGKFSSGSNTGTKNTVAANTSSTGAHTHTVNIATFNSASTGGVETRPRNVNVIYIIKH